MKNFSNWLHEQNGADQKSEGHKKANLLLDYIDEGDLIAGMMGRPTKGIVYRFLSILDTLPSHERAEFQQQLAQLQQNYMAVMQQQGGEQSPENQSEQEQQ